MLKYEKVDTIKYALRRKDTGEFKKSKGTGKLYTTPNLAEAHLWDKVGFAKTARPRIINRNYNKTIDGKLDRDYYIADPIWDIVSVKVIAEIVD